MLQVAVGDPKNVESKMVSKCGVCHNEHSKYKCPICELR